MADSESKSPVASSSAVTMVTSLNAPPSDVVEAVNQSTEIIPALFALPSESGDTKKLKLCKRVGWLRNGVFTTGFMEINIKEAKQKGIFNQPRQVTLIQEGDSIFQPQVIQGEKPPSCKQLSSLMIQPGKSTKGLISARGAVIPKKITVVKNVPGIHPSPGKLVALGKAPSLGTSANKAGTLAKTAKGNQKQTEVYEFDKNFSSIVTKSHCIATPKVDERKPQDSALGSPHLDCHSEEPLLVKIEDLQEETEQIHDVPTSESQAHPVKKRRRELKNAPRITRAKIRDSISSKVNHFGLPWADTYRLQSSSNPKLDILKLDIDFSRHNVLQMEGLIKSPCDSTSSEFNSSGQIEMTETTQSFSNKSQKASEFHSPLSKEAMNKPLGDQTISQSKSRTVNNLQCTSELSKQKSFAEEQKQSTDVLVCGAEAHREVLLRKRKFGETPSTPSTPTAASKLKRSISGELSTSPLSCGELSVNCTKVADSETPESSKATLGSGNNRSLHYDTNTFVQNERDGCSQVSLSGNTDVLIQHKIPKDVAPDTSDDLTNANRLQDEGVEALSQNNNSMSANLPTCMSAMQTVGQQTSIASRAIPVNFSTSVHSDFESRKDHHVGNISRKKLSATTISETNEEQSSLPSDSSVDKNVIDQASDGCPLLQIDSVYSLSAEEAKRLFPTASIEKGSERVEMNQSPVDLNMQVSSTTNDLDLSATQVEVEPLDTSRDSQPSQPEAFGTSVWKGQTPRIETISSTPCMFLSTLTTSSSTLTSTVTSTGMHTMSLPSVVCMNGKVFKLVSSRSPGKVNKTPHNSMGVIVIAQKDVEKSVDQNVKPKPLHESHSQMSGIQVWKAPSLFQHLKVPTTSIIVTSKTTRTSSVHCPSVSKSPLFPTNIPVQSTVRRFPLFQSRLPVELKTTSIPASVIPTVLSEVSSSTSAGSICTAVSSSSSAGSICSAETDAEKPTQPGLPIASHLRDISESEEQRAFLVTTTQGEKELLSFPSTADGVHILSQVAQKRDHQVVLEHFEDEIPRIRSRNDEIFEKQRQASKHTQRLPDEDGDTHKKKGNSLKSEIGKNPQFDLEERPVTRKRRGPYKPSPEKIIMNCPSGSHRKKATTSNVTTQALDNSLQVTSNKDLGGKYNTSEVTKPLCIRKRGRPRKTRALPYATKRDRLLITNEKGARLSSDVKKDGSTPKTESNVSGNGGTPATQLNIEKGAVPSSPSCIRKRGRPPKSRALSRVTKRDRLFITNEKGARLSSDVKKYGSTPKTQSNVSRKVGRPTTALNTNEKGAARRGRPPKTPTNTNRKGATPSSQSNGRRKSRPQVTLSNVSRNAALPSAVKCERSTHSILSNALKESCPTPLPVDVNHKSNAQSAKSRVKKKRSSTSPATRSGVKKRNNSTSSLSPVNQKSSVPGIRSSFNRNDTTISFLSDVYQAESSSPSYIVREDRLIQLKRIMRQKERDIEDMKKLRQLEEREKLSDPELCDLYQ